MVKKIILNQFSIVIFIWVSILFISCSNEKKSQNVIFNNYGITKSPKEAVVYLDPQTSVRYIVIENAHINKVEYKSNSGTIFSGDIYPFDSRPIKSRFFIFEVAPTRKMDTVKLTLDKSGENLSYTIKVFDKKSYDTYERNDNIAIGIIIGFYGVAIMISLILFFYLQSKKILYFFLYTLFSLGWILNDGGILYEYLWPNSALFHKSSRGIFSSITIILFALYIHQNKNKFFHKNIIRVIVFTICILFFKLINAFIVARGLFPDSFKYSSIYLNAIVLFIIFLSVFIFILTEIKKHRKDIYEMLAILVYCLFVLSLVLNELGFSFFMISNIHQFQALPFFFIQLIFMSIHLFKIEAQEKRERELAFIEFKINQERETDRKILEVEENEKKRIAQNIHDEIGGVFVALKYQILSIKQKITSETDLKNLDSLINLSNEGIKKQYSIIDDLLFDINNTKNFESILKDYCNLIILNQHIQLDISVNINEHIWSTVKKTQLYRIIVELITNTIKHAEASIIRIEINDDEFITVTYSDNGKGFDINKIKEGNGIKNIRKRVNALNGDLFFSKMEGLSFVNIKIPFYND